MANLETTKNLKNGQNLKNSKNLKNLKNDQNLTNGKIGTWPKYQNEKPLHLSARSIPQMSKAWLAR